VNAVIVLLGPIIVSPSQPIAYYVPRVLTRMSLVLLASSANPAALLPVGVQLHVLSAKEGRIAVKEPLLALSVSWEHTVRKRVVLVRAVQVESMHLLVKENALSAWLAPTLLHLHIHALLVLLVNTVRMVLRRVYRVLRVRSPLPSNNLYASHVPRELIVTLWVLLYAYRVLLDTTLLVKVKGAVVDVIMGIIHPLRAT
jgi:hypothetical protein